MRIADNLLPEFDQEMATTRKMLERVPGDKMEWKPHPKSFSMGHLVQLIAGMPAWLVAMLTQPELDLKQQAGYTTEKPETLLAQFDANARAGRAALAAASDEEFGKQWSLKMGDQLLFTLPRTVVVRQHINHFVHHRGQLSVYLRLVGVPLPSIYGPTADEKW